MVMVGACKGRDVEVGFSESNENEAKLYVFRTIRGLGYRTQGLDGRVSETKLGGSYDILENDKLMTAANVFSASLPARVTLCLPFLPVRRLRVGCDRSKMNQGHHPMTVSSGRSP